ncbi:hypothetical protein FKW77_010093 [Venturia effusa]|uniref:C3H1-type domain-containing protein n=1 Tax=Venturia effusa TaxID=50376 RepID=A0A517L8C0_9PEZI|nr:hypothetical protein FKW77_010093 [Venturia effusa]
MKSQAIIGLLISAAALTVAAPTCHPTTPISSTTDVSNGCHHSSGLPQCDEIRGSSGETGDKMENVKRHVVWGPYCRFHPDDEHCNYLHKSKKRSAPTQDEKSEKVKPQFDWSGRWQRVYPPRPHWVLVEYKKRSAVNQDENTEKTRRRVSWGNIYCRIYPNEKRCDYLRDLEIVKRHTRTNEHKSSALGEVEGCPSLVVPK